MPNRISDRQPDFDKAVRDAVSSVVDDYCDDIGAGEYTVVLDDFDYPILIRGQVTFTIPE